LLTKLGQNPRPNGKSKSCSNQRETRAIE